MKSGVFGGLVSKRRNVGGSVALLLVSGIVGLTGACSGDDEADPNADVPRKAVREQCVEESCRALATDLGVLLRATGKPVEAEDGAEPQLR